MIKRLYDFLYRKSAQARTCPYCGFLFEKEIERNRKCSECKNKIVVRKDNGKPSLFTEEQAAAFDVKKQKQRTRKAYIKHLQAIGGSEKEFSQREKLLGKKFKKHPSFGDVFWSLSNEYLENAMKKNYYEAAKSIYWHQARVLYDLEKRDPYLPLRESNKMQLMGMKRASSSSRFILEVCGRGDCDTASEINGERFTIDEALEKMPIPQKDCKRGFCDCMYLSEDKDSIFFSE